MTTVLDVIYTRDVILSLTWFSEIAAATFATFLFSSLSLSLRRQTDGQTLECHPMANDRMENIFWNVNFVYTRHTMLWFDRNIWNNNILFGSKTPLWSVCVNEWKCVFNATTDNQSIDYNWHDRCGSLWRTHIHAWIRFIAASTTDIGIGTKPNLFRMMIDANFYLIFIHKSKRNTNY